MNLGQMRTQIDRRTGKLQDIPAANAYINEAIQTISSHREWPWLDALQTITAVLDQSIYDVPATYSETRSVIIDNGEARQIYIADGDSFPSANTLTDAWYQYTIEWDNGAAQLQIFPNPRATATILHRYTRTEALLSADSSSPLMPERYHTIICDLATALFLERLDTSRAQYYHDRVTKGLRSMVEGVQRKTNPGRIRIREGFPY